MSGAKDLLLHHYQSASVSCLVVLCVYSVLDEQIEKKTFHFGPALFFIDFVFNGRWVYIRTCFFFRKQPFLLPHSPYWSPSRQNQRQYPRQLSSHQRLSLPLLPNSWLALLFFKIMITGVTANPVTLKVVVMTQLGFLRLAPTLWEPVSSRGPQKRGGQLFMGWPMESLRQAADPKMKMDELSQPLSNRLWSLSVLSTISCRNTALGSENWKLPWRPRSSRRTKSMWCSLW